MIDIQSTPSGHPFALNAAGIVNLRYPFVARDAATGACQSVTGDWRLSVGLAAGRRGAHMSRFVAELDRLVAAGPLDQDGLAAFAGRLTAVLEAVDAEVSVRFLWFRRRAAPVSKQAALLELAVTMSAAAGGAPRASTCVQLSAKALCPCSKAVSDRGAHNQRSDITITVHGESGLPAPERLAQLAESCASAPVYPLLKREDEKHLTELAYDQPAFVEDITRGIATRLSDLPNVTGFRVEVVNRESIHAHDCYAVIEHTVRP